MLCESCGAHFAEFPARFQVRRAAQNCHDFFGQTVTSLFTWRLLNQVRCSSRPRRLRSPLPVFHPHHLLSYSPRTISLVGACPTRLPEIWMQRRNHLTASRRKSTNRGILLFLNWRSVLFARGIISPPTN